MIDKKQCIYEMKNSKHLIAFSFIIYFLSFPFLNLINYERARIDYLLFPIFILFLSSFILPWYIFRFTTDKRALDTFYSLGIKRKKYFDTKIFLTILIMIIPYIINLILGLIILYLNNLYTNTFAEIIKFSILALILAILLLGFNLWAFNKANSLLDGILINIAYHVLPAIMILCFVYIADGMYAGNRAYLLSNKINYISLIYNIGIVLSYFFEKINIAQAGTSYINSKLDLTALIVILIITIFSWVLFYIEINKRRAEASGQLSNNIFAYPGLNLLALISLMLTANYYNSENIVNMFAIYTIIFIIYLIANFIYKREIKISFKIVGIFIFIAILSNIFAYTIVKTEFFKLPYRYTSNYKFINVSFRYSLNKESEDLELEVRVKDKNDIKLLQEIQDKCVKNYYMLLENKKAKREMADKAWSCINFTYEINSKKSLGYSYYYIQNTDMDIFLKELDEHGIKYKSTIYNYSDDGDYTSKDIYLSYKELLETKGYKNMMEK